MTIEILETTITTDELGNDESRAVTISIDNGTDFYLWYVGNLPLTGDLQTILEAQESELWAKAVALGQTFDVFEVKERRLLKAFALVVMDEINILRAQHGLTARNESQIRTALKNKLASM